LNAPFLVAAGAALSASLMALFLYETAPVQLNKTNNNGSVATTTIELNRLV
jgi:hypothetical protein